MSSVDVLRKILRPPESPSETPDVDGWQSVEAKLGMPLPVDYKEFITCYGTGAIDGFLWVLNPFSKNKYLNLLDSGNSQLDGLRQLRDECGEKIPYAIFPEANGLFPWGITDNGDVLYWVCSGPPSNWPIVVNESRGPCWREFKLTTGEFLAKLVSRELQVDIFPDDFPSDSPEFVPRG